MALEDRKQRAPFTFAKVKNVFTSWHIWLLSLYYMYAQTQPKPRP
jgi:ACS family pantothenate transporter-like MFS transporter